MKNSIMRIAVLGIVVTAVLSACKSDDKGLTKIISGDDGNRTCAEVKGKPEVGKYAVVVHSKSYYGDVSYSLGRISGVFAGDTRITIDTLDYFGGPVDGSLTVNSDKVKTEIKGCDGVAPGKSVLVGNTSGGVLTSGVVVVVFEGEMAIVQMNGSRSPESKHILADFAELSL